MNVVISLDPEQGLQVAPPTDSGEPLTDFFMPAVSCLSNQYLHGGFPGTICIAGFWLLMTGGGG